MRFDFDVFSSVDISIYYMHAAFKVLLEIQAMIFYRTKTSTFVQSHNERAIISTHHCNSQFKLSILRICFVIILIIFLAIN